MPAADIERLIERAREAANFVSDEVRHGASVLVVSHYDADGLAAASIVGAALSRLDASMHLRVVKELDDSTLSEIRNLSPDLLVFTDIGSGYVGAIGAAGPKGRMVVLDHHPPSSQPPSGVVHVNPHDHGIDGARDISSAGIAYLFAKEIDSSNTDLAPLAVVGAVGDMQDKNEKRALRAVNELIVNDATAKGTIRTDTDLIFYGRETRPIQRALAYTTTPYMPGLSGAEDTCLALLTTAGIPVKEGERWRTLADLSQEEKQKLLSSIIEFLVGRGFQGSVALGLIGTVYTIVKESPGTATRDAREYASLLNACGRMDRPSLGVAVCMGDRGQVMDEVTEVLSTYRSTLADYIRWLGETEGAVVEMATICVVRSEDKIGENMTGALSSILSSAGHLRPDKATIVMARSREGGVKVSARAPDALLRKGADLGSVLREAAETHGGFGGGHDVAAGAHVPYEAQEDFLKTVDVLIAKQIGKTV